MLPIMAPQVILEDGLIAASITGNCFRDTSGVTNRSTAQVELGFNTIQ